MKVHGRCHCGAIRYEADVDPAAAMICHCTDCQMLTGSAYRVNIQAPAATFRLLSGTPKTYVKKTAESGTPRVHAFCPECGTPVYSAAAKDTPTYSLRIGCLDERAHLAPQRRIWARSSMPWSIDIGRIPSIERQ